MDRTPNEEGVSDAIFTIPNLISFIRLCCIPVFFILLLGGRSIAATILFSVAAATDWVDGKLARSTNSVSKLGQILDPMVDRLLMISGVVGLLVVGRLPLWILVLVVLRDLLMLAGGAYILKAWNLRVRVIYLGKVATTFLYTGFAWLLLNMPVVAGLGLVSGSWLPGFNTAPHCLGIWLVYIGLVLAIITTVYYVICTCKRIDAIRNGASASQDEGK